jgi:hypothetical protein
MQARIAQNAFRRPSRMPSASVYKAAPMMVMFQPENQ